MGSDFGLGLVLSFTDNATQGINNAVNSLEQLTGTAQQAGSSLNELASLTAFSAIATTMGNSMVSAGEAILSTFTQVIGKVNETGQTLMYAENQLGKLYEGSGRTGKQVLNDISQYAKTSIFEFEDLIPVVTMLKANGIEAFDAITSSSGQSSQMLMDYAADLAAFNPQMKNAYGTGIRAAMGALNEYIAEGNARSLKAGASLDITALLGEEKGATIEERSRQVADLLEKLNMVGMTAQLAQSPMTKLSNMQDTLFQFVGMISNSGVYDSYSRIISIISDFVNTIPDERLQSIASTIGDALSSLMKPVEALASKLVTLADSFLTFIDEHPQVAKMVIRLGALAGVLLVVGGVALKLMGSMGYLSIMLKNFGGSFSAITGVIRGGITKIIGSILPLALVVGTLYAVWKTDFAGIRTTVTGFVTNVSNSFRTARDAVSGDIESMKRVISTLDTEHSFFDGLTLAIMKLMVVGLALSEGWNTFTLSDDTFQRAQELGILPLIQALFDLKYRFDKFKEGFIEGWNTIGNAIKSVFSGIKDAVSGTIFESAFNSITRFFEKLTNNDPEQWKQFGKVIGEITAVLLPFIAVMKLLNKVSLPFSRGSSGGGILSRLFGGSSSGGSSSSGGLLSSPAKVAKNMASLAILIGGVVLVVEALGVLNSNPYFSAFLSSGITAITKLSSAILSIAKVSAVMAILVKALDVIKVSPKSAALGIANLAIMLGGLDLIVTALGALNSIPGFANFLSQGASTMDTLAGVLDTMFSLSFIGTIGAIAAFGLVPVPTVLLGLANLAIVLAGLTALISAFAALSMIDGFDDFLVSGGDTLALLFEQVGKIAGSLIGGFAEGVTDSLPAIGENLAQFGNNIKPFFDAVSDAPLGAIAEFAAALGVLMICLAGEELLSFITGGVDLPGLGSQLSQFGTNVTPFFTAMSAIGDDAIEKSEKVLKSLGDIGNYSFRSGGVAQFFTGEVDLAAIGTQLAAFAPNGLTYFNTVANYSDEGLEKSPKVFEAIGGIGQYGFKMGGVAQFFTGETAIDQIGAQLAAFAPSGLTFFNTVANYSQAGLDKAPKVFEAISGIGDYDFKTGGLAQLFTGSTDLKNLGDQLTNFGNSALGFFNVASSISDKGITNAAAMVKAVSDLGQFKSGGLVELFTGSLDITDLGNQLSTFGQNIAPFFNTCASITDKGITNAQKVIDVLSTLNTGAFKSGGLAQLFTGEISLANIGSELSAFGASSRVFFTIAAGLDDKGFSNAIRMFNSLKGVDNLVSAAVQSNGSIRSFGTELVSFANSFETFINKANDLQDMDGVNALITSIQDLSTKLGTLNTDTSTAVSGITTSFTQLQTSFTATKDNFSTNTTAISTSMSTMASQVKSELASLVSTFASTRFEIPQTHIKLPHFTMSGQFNLQNGTVPSLSVNWYARGGVFDQPSLIGVGEQGREAVVPLDRNTEWIGLLANRITSSLAPVMTHASNSDGNVMPQTSSEYVNNTTNTREGDTKNTSSVVFSEGSIVINVKNATEEEAERLATLVMEKIKRKQEIENMRNYQPVR